ncbi:MAG: hypothetical protein KAT65_25505 [Methanophagales archaeon]|uniref:PemK-like protein n=1 Tax=Candidatus Methanophaga sp. ANME-1 ERB7 TaxID=2759913 RepID=A0A7G9Z8R3_9EURY|nr:hypothetical protein [Methanophagales archaeon]QNO54130.1 hypothetical protein PCFKKONE_00034 [Methanosarcinales archaeon ANME-1 ERB7]QNO56612.1 hypothetical protein GDLDPPJJ_00039 [Methanosarcinales archaeon ANME-1 ERB7]QNO56647.1 hypothetical protein HANIDNDE_00033 [Methanosarcinales archaeon ANME-1 ERB7]
MERFVKGDVVVVPFPFSDLSSAKRRPALVIAELEGDDLSLCNTFTYSDLSTANANVDITTCGYPRATTDLFIGFLLFCHYLSLSYCLE